MENRVAAIVPWWDHAELLSWWPDNLRRFGWPNTVFVDNGGGEDARRQIEEFARTYNLLHVRHDDNRGYPGGCNAGAAAAAEKWPDTTHYLFLNNDINVVMGTSLPDTLAVLAGDGVAGPGPLVTPPPVMEAYLEGWCLCVNRKAFEAVGGFDESFGPGYWDDVDLCHRLRRAGYPLRPVDLTCLHHFGNTTGRDGRLNQLGVDAANRDRFREKLTCGAINH